MLDELANALRALRRQPVFTFLAVVTLALGIGTSTAVFSIVHAVVLRPLPYPEPDRLVDISHLTRENRRLMVPWYDLAALRATEDVFESVEFRLGQVSPVALSDDDASPVHVRALWVSRGYMETLGVEPFLGRHFAPDDQLALGESPSDSTEESRPQMVMITHGLWVRAFGADPAILERPVRMAGFATRVVGVLPPDFRLLHERLHRWVSGTSAEVFVIFPDVQGAERPEGRPSRSTLFLARMKPSVEVAAAQASLDAVAARLMDEVPAYRDEELRIVAYPVHDDLTEAGRPILLVLVGGIVFLMLLVSANVANLVLVRGHVRSGPDAVRAVIGCGNGRLVREKLLEGGLIALGGGLLGVALAWIGIAAVARLAPPSLPLIDRSEMSLASFAVSMAIALAAVLVAGLLPSLQALRLDLVGLLGSNGRGGSARGRRRLMDAMVASELALSVILLTGATVMTRSLIALVNERVGFEAEDVFTFDLAGMGPEYADPETRRAFAQSLEERLMAIPGVVAVGRTSMPPLSDRIFNRPYGRDSDDLQRGQRRADVVVVNRSYFDAMGTRLLAGRLFEESEMAEQGASVIVDETVADRTWPGEGPIGKRLLVGPQEKVVVGVVEPVLMRGRGVITLEAVYQPEVFVGSAYSYVVRAPRAGDDVAAAIREAVRAVDPALVPYGIESLSERVAQARAPTRFVVFAMGTLSLIALVVAIGGLFAVVSYAVRTRTSELGIRMALGADRAAVTAMVLRQGGTLTALGLLIGLLGVFPLSRFLSVIAYEASANDPLALSSAAVLLGIAATLACWVPARWASGIDPAETLRR